MTKRPPSEWITLAARLILGLVLLIAGALKFSNMASSIEAVRAYRMLPYAMTAPVGLALPIIEFVIGLMLILGLFTRVSAVLGSLMMVAYLIAIGYVWSHGISIDCGCFGGGGGVDLDKAVAGYRLDTLRDVGLLLCGIWATIKPKAPFSADAALFPPLPEP